MDHQNIRIDYLLHLADNSMILGQRNAEWCGHGPILEQDIALTNISLDLFGEARNLYNYIAKLKGGNTTEDTVAFLRDVLEYRNLLLVEQPNIDWAYTIVRQFFFDVFHFYQMTALCQSNDENIRSIAIKSLKECTYHLKWSSEWVIRLGDGTEVSHQKTKTALEDLWDYTSELFMPSETEIKAAELGFGADISLIKPLWEQKVNAILTEATLLYPETKVTQKGGKTGLHSEHLGFVLAEMQFLQRAYPGAEW